MADNEDEIQAWLRHGPEKAFPAIYKRFSGPLFRFIYRFTGSHHSAEEILHDTFLELLSGKFSESSGSNLKSWLFTVARNKSLNFQKKNSFEIKNLEVIDNTASDFDLVEKTVGESRLQKLAAAEKHFPQDLQKTWDLKKQGYDYQQIATELAIPVGTVKSRFFRLVEHLKKEFKDEF